MVRAQLNAVSDRIDVAAGKTRWKGLALIFVVGILFLVLALPALQGYHLGCNVGAGDNVRMTRFGILWCKQVPRADVPGPAAPAERPFHF